MVFRGSYETAERLYQTGAMGERDWRRYVFAWSWSCERWSGPAAEAQERAYQRGGMREVYRRINRVRHALGLKAFECFCLRCTGAGK